MSGSALLRASYRRGLDRRELESLGDYLERLWQDPLFEGATASEVARFAGCKRVQAVKARRNLYRRRKADLILAHAEAVAEAIGWAHDPSLLVTLALERYLDRLRQSDTRAAGGDSAVGGSGGKGPDRVSGDADASPRGGLKA